MEPTVGPQRFPTHLRTPSPFSMWSACNIHKQPTFKKQIKIGKIIGLGGLTPGFGPQMPHPQITITDMKPICGHILTLGEEWIGTSLS